MEPKTNWIATIVVGALILLLVIGMTVVNAQRHYYARRGYRLTADVVADGRHYTASQNYAYDCGSRDNVVTASRCELYGTAVHVDLGAHGSLFITMNGWNADHSDFAGADLMVHQLLQAAQHGQSVPPAAIPVIVRFRDATDPNTVEIVDPEHLDRSFGPGVALRSLTIDFGTAPQSAGDIQADLPWLAALKGGRLSPAPGTLAHDLHGFDFEWPPA
jgi:hypothetical protein